VKVRNDHIILDAKAKFYHGFKQDAERISLQYRQLLKLEYHAPLPSKLLAKYIELDLKTPSEIPGLSEESLQDLYGEGSDSWSGITLPTKYNGVVVIFNPKESTARRESTLMHEMSHIILNHKPSVIGSTKAVSIPLRNYDPIQENEASWLGSCLQLPREMLLWCCKNKMDREEIARYAYASMKMTQFRLNVSGVTKQVKHWH
jgi:hypothetical protein